MKNATLSLTYDKNNNVVISFESLIRYLQDMTILAEDIVDEELGIHSESINNLSTIFLRKIIQQLDSFKRDFDNGLYVQES